jgi:hypothetical protein
MSRQQVIALAILGMVVIAVYALAIVMLGDLLHGVRPDSQPSNLSLRPTQLPGRLQLLPLPGRLIRQFPPGRLAQLERLRRWSRSGPPTHASPHLPTRPTLPSRPPPPSLRHRLHFRPPSPLHRLAGGWYLRLRTMHW